MAKKTLPHNTEAEKAVLGAMIRSNSLVAEAVAKLTVDDFYEGNENHRAIFAAMLRLYTQGTPVDSQTVTNELINAKELEISGAPEYLIELADSVVTFENFDDYVRIVQDHSVLRSFLQTIKDIEEQYYSKGIDEITDFISESEKKITAVTEKRRLGDFQRSEEISAALAIELANLKSSTSNDEVTGTPTGFSKLNILTHGFHGGEFIVLAARPGIGKTALALNLAFNATTYGNVPVAYFSLEMPSKMLFKRLVSADAEIDFDNLITGFGLDQNKRLKLQQSCEKMATKRIYVDDTAGIKLLDLVAKCRKLKAKEPDLGLIVVDYIGLITTTTKTKSESRQLEVQLISQTLKKLALDLNVPVIGVAQLNRNVENRGGEPQLSDLRESGSIEQDADIVMMLHEKKFTTGKETSKNVIAQHNAEVLKAEENATGANSDDLKLVDLFIRKNRSGKMGRVPLLFRKNRCKFSTLSEEAERKYNELESESINYLPSE